MKPDCVKIVIYRYAALVALAALVAVTLAYTFVFK